MMTREKFAYLFAPVVDRFGDKNFSTQALSLLYSKLHLLNQDQVRELSEACLLEFTFAPSLSKIIALAKPQLDEAYDLQKKEKLSKVEDNPCHMCGNTGWVDAIDTNTPQHYRSAFACTCVVGKNFIGPKDVNKWDESVNYPRFLPDYKVRNQSGGGTVGEHIEAAERKHFFRLGEVMRINGSAKEIKENFMKLEDSERIKVVLELANKN